MTDINTQLDSLYDDINNALLDTATNIINKINEAGGSSEAIDQVKEELLTEIESIKSGVLALTNIKSDTEFILSDTQTLLSDTQSIKDGIVAINDVRADTQAILSDTQTLKDGVVVINDVKSDTESLCPGQCAMART